MAINKGSYAASKVAFELNGKFAGYLKSCDVGTWELEKVEHAAGSFLEKRKSGGGMKYGAQSASYAVSESGDMMNWIMSLPRKKCVTADGAFVMANHDFVATHRVDFSEAYMQEVKFPSCDSSANKQAFMLDCKFQPNYRKHSAGGGKITAEQSKTQKTWSSANYRIMNFPFETKFVTKIDLPTITAKLANETYGESRHIEYHYAAMDCTDVVLHCSGGLMRDKVMPYIEKVIADGKLTDSEYFSAQVDFLDPSLQQTLGSVILDGLGLYKYTEQKLEAGQEKSNTFELHFTCENANIQAVQK
jgi:hypothetical protein